MVLGTAMQTYGEKLTDEQEVLLRAADILIDTYAAESAVLRLRTRSAPAARARSTWRRRGLRQRCRAARGGRDQRARRDGRGDTLRTLLAALRRILKATRSTPSHCVGRSPTTGRRGGYIVN